MPNISDLKVLKPHRGNRQVMNRERSNLVLERGEMFFEFEGEVGSSNARIKFGDGVTGYSNLPYALGDIESSNDISLAEGILPIEHGGTGNPYGYIITGMGNIYETEYNSLKDQYLALINEYKSVYETNESAEETWAKISHDEYTIIDILNIDTTVYPPYTGQDTGASFTTNAIITDLGKTPYYGTALEYTAKNIGLGEYATAEGYKTVANSKYQSIMGRYNIPDTPDTDDGIGEYAVIVGIGRDENNRKNGFTVDWDGNVTATGRIKAPNYTVGNLTLDRYILSIIEQQDSYAARAGQADVALAIDWDNVTNKQESYPPSYHTHDIAEIDNFDPSTFSVGYADQAGVAGSIDWNNINNKPTRFDPNTHTHSYTEIRDLSSYIPNRANIANSADSVNWNNIQNPPTEYKPIDHEHEWNQIKWEGYQVPKHPHIAQDISDREDYKWPNAANADHVDWDGIRNKPEKYQAASHRHDKSEIDGWQDPEILKTVDYLAHARNLKTNLASEDSQLFDGSEDAENIGVTGILHKIHGGTGNSNGTVDALTTARNLKVNLASNLAASFNGSANASIGVEGTLPIGYGGTGNTLGHATGLVTPRELAVNLANSSTISQFDGTSNLRNIQVTGILDKTNGGTGNNFGGAAKFATPINIVTDLGDGTTSTGAVSFDGSNNTNIGITGILPIINGGTGNSEGSVAKLTTARQLKVDLENRDTICTFDGSAAANNIQVGGILGISNGGTGNNQGAAAKLANAIQLSTDLSTIGSTSFDGATDSTIGVTGLLPIEKGGTGNPNGYIITGKTPGSLVGIGATIEGENNTISGDYSYGTGYGNTISSFGKYSAALGKGNKVYAPFSIVAGENNKVLHEANHSAVFGYNNEAVTPGQTIIGINANTNHDTIESIDVLLPDGTIQFNTNITESNLFGSLFIIGDGIEGAEYTTNPTTNIHEITNLVESNRHNCFRVVPFTYHFDSGNPPQEPVSSNDVKAGIYFFGKVHYNGADYAEMFEWKDGNKNNEDRAGRFVTLDGEKIVYANSNTDIEDILGIVSAAPSIIGDSGSENWEGMYEKDIFGRLKYQKGFSIPAHKETVTVTDKNGKEIEKEITIPERHCMERKISSKYDASKRYTPRTHRSEWDTVGLLGKLVMVDDGTAQVNGFVRPSDRDGIATKSDTRTPYRVMARLDAAHIKVYIKP